MILEKEMTFQHTDHENFPDQPYSEETELSHFRGVFGKIPEYNQFQPVYKLK